MANKKNVRGKLMSFRVSEEEHELIAGLARENELGVSDYIRRRALSGNIVQPKMSRAEMQEVVRILQKIQGELGKQGSNLNQIARYCRLIAPKQGVFRVGGIFTLEKKVNALEGEYERFRGGVVKIWQLLAK